MSMENVKQIVNLGNKDPAAVLEGLIALQVLFGIVFLICSFVVASTENVGFNVVLTGILNLVFAVASYYSLAKLKTPIIVGGVMGAGVMISFLTFMTSIFWGQLSFCETVTESIKHYSCEHKMAYSVTCFFATAIFIFQLSFTSFLVYSRDTVLKEFNEYEEISIFPNESGIGSDLRSNHSQSSGPNNASADL